jgi:heme/copper-type cytochrome/quinol oxidase subunit 2
MMETILNQITWAHALVLYLVVCVGIALFFIGVFAYEDFRMYREPWRRQASKFGYNYKSGMSWIMLAFAAIPFLNLASFSLYIFLWGKDKAEGLFKEANKDAKSV